MKITKSIDWIFFDAGGVLLDETKHEERRINLILEAVKGYKPEINKEYILKVRPKASGMLGGLTTNIIKLLLLDQVQQESAIKKVKVLDKKADQCGYTFVRPEAKEVVKKLTGKYNLGLLANQPVATKEKLDKVGILQYFKFQGVSEDFHLRKPDPKFFKVIFKTTGADPKVSVIIDDNIERGLIPAKKLGMTTVWYKLEDREVLESIDFTISSLNELLKIFL